MHPPLTSGASGPLRRHLRHPFPRAPRLVPALLPAEPKCHVSASGLDPPTIFDLRVRLFARRSPPVSTGEFIIEFFEDDVGRSPVEERITPSSDLELAALVSGLEHPESPRDHVW